MVVPLFVNDIDSSAVAKNELLSMIYAQEYDSIIFIDHNMAWDPVALLDIVKSPYDAVALPCVKKTPNGPIFDLDLGENIERDLNGKYIKVNFTSTSVFKLTKKLVTELSDSNISITNPTGNEVKNVFETSTKYGKFFNESIVLCNKIKDLSTTIWLNPSSTCATIAGNVFAADFEETLKQQLQSNPAEQAAPAQPQQQVVQAPTPEEIKSLYE